MRRHHHRRPSALIPLLLLAAFAPFLGGAAERLPTPPALAAAGWQLGAWRGMPPARFEPLLPVRVHAGAEDALPGVALHAEPGQGGFVWRPLSGTPGCLAWRWRVEQGPPPTDLARRGGEDRAVSITIGFDGWATDAGAWVRGQYALAQAAAGDGGPPLPRSVLTYVWGGTGREPQPFFANPYMGGIGRVRVLRPADAPHGVWVEERVDLAADWRAAFGGHPPPALVKVAVGTDADDTRSRVRAAVADLRLVRCG